MASIRDVQRLVQVALDSDLTPEQVCRSSPALLAEVRPRWERCRQIRAEIESLFPTSGTGKATGTGPDGASAAASRRRPLLAGELPTIPGHVVEAVIGRGGVGVVYRARHLRLERTVAVKMLLAGPHASRLERARFLREARAVASLHHDHIVQVYDVGETAGGVPFFTMELVDGGTLADRLAGTPQPPATAAALAATLADAVAAAHRLGIVHRDLKPANVLLAASDGSPKVGDFGLVRHVGGTGDGEEELTLTWARVGTPSYMAPEQAAGRSGTVGPPADVYALGAILYEMLTSRPPFLGTSAGDTERQLLTEEPVPPRRISRQVPRDLETICLKCLMKDPARRYPTAGALADDLARLRDGRPIAARPVGRPELAIKWGRRNPVAVLAAVAASTVALALIAGVGVLLWLMSGRAATAAAVKLDLNEAVRCQARSAWPDARAALDRATARLGSGGPAALRARLAAVRRDDDLVARLEDVRLHHRISEGRRDRDDCDKAYAAVFHDFGVAEPAEDPAAVAARIRASNVRDALVAALDDWRFGGRTEQPRSQWLYAILTRADADPAGWRNRMRNPATWNDGDRLEAAADAVPVDQESPAFLFAVCGELSVLERNPVRFLTRAQASHPSDFWLNIALGASSATWSNPAEALRYYQAALAVRPDAAIVHLDIGLALVDLGRLPDATGEIRAGLRLDPTSAAAHGCLGIALGKGGDLAGAIPELERGLRGLPDEPGFATALGDALRRTGRLAEAVGAFRRAVAVAPRSASARIGLQTALVEVGRSDEAIAAWQDGIRAIPTAHTVWDGYAEYLLFLGHDDAYRRARAALLHQFGDSRDTSVCERTGRACLLLPGTPDELRTATAMIDRALKLLRPELPGARPYYLFAKGLAEYRAGHFAAAVEILDGPAATALKPAPQLVASMARFRLGQTDAARRQLAGAIASFDWGPEHADGREAQIYHILRREAEGLARQAGGAVDSH